MIKFKVLWRTLAHDDEFSVLSLRFQLTHTSLIPRQFFIYLFIYLHDATFTILNTTYNYHNACYTYIINNTYYTYNTNSNYSIYTIYQTNGINLQ